MTRLRSRPRSRSRPARATPEPIAPTPELAILGVLDELLERARRTLLAAHPGLGDPGASDQAGDRDALGHVGGRDALDPAARGLIAHAAALQRAIRTYEAATNAPDGPIDDASDLPF